MISATPCLTSYMSFSEATARSGRTAKLLSEALSGWVARWALIDTGICRMKACRITAVRTTEAVPNPAVFWSLRRNLDGMSDPIFSPDMTLLTLWGVVKPLLSISMLLRLSYFRARIGCSKHHWRPKPPSPKEQHKSTYISHHHRWYRAGQTDFQSGWTTIRRQLDKMLLF